MSGWSDLRLAQRVHGPVNGVLVTAYRACYRRRWITVGYAIQCVSDRIASFWFMRRLRKAYRP